MALIKAVQCDQPDCEKIMDANSCEYFTVMGNIMIGQSGGLIGNNLDEGGKVTNTVYFCTTCFLKVVNDAGKQPPAVRQDKEAGVRRTTKVEEA